MNHRLPSFWPLVALAVPLALTGCGQQESGPWVTFDGGGFVVNYSGGYGAAFYGFNAKPLRRLPAGTVLEASFEDPAGGPPIIDKQQVTEPALRYSFRTPYLHGIVAHHPYKAEVHVLEAGTGKLLGSYQTNFVSQVDDAWLQK